MDIDILIGFNFSYYFECNIIGVKKLYVFLMISMKYIIRSNETMHFSYASNGISLTLVTIR